ncbi:TonB-dependent receptor [Microscilla marina]|uniref:TonB-dependent receptor, putative n=1 Tax=Microscilla marina ATCC 23134 TaxID=313606 RepID=A1ZS10_MICM2|nr:TonB-dependent receptor [Microscilla marina]EAY26898.1 TonB-dependent receptor, putative [Microscilla marina ATCC 23134]
MKYIIFCAALCLASIHSFAQTIHGTISDQESGEVIPFATIYNMQQKTGVTTNTLGQFSIIANIQADSLTISCIGYQAITVLARNPLNIQLTPNALTLNEVVVSVNREHERRTEAPVAISSISSKTIEENKPTTIDQVLNQVPGVNMVALGSEQHTMSIRRPIDFGASYLYLEDGVPIRTSGVFNHNALLEINMANTSRIEIIRGPASSMYGSEAIGGAVNFISRKSSALFTAGISVQGNDIGYKRTDFYASNSFGKKLGVRVSGYYADQRDGVVSHSDFDKLALSLSATYSISKNTELVWSNTLIDYYAQMSGSLDSTNFYSKTYTSNHTFTNRQVDAFRTKLALNHYWNDQAKSTVTGYYRNNSVKQNPSYRVRDDFRPWIPSGNPRLAHGEVNDNSFNSYGLIMQHKQDFSWLNSSLIVGGSFDYSPNTYQAHYIQVNKNDEGVYDSFTKTDSLLADYGANLTNVAAYAQIKLSPLKGLNIIGALRYDQFNYSFDNHLGANAFTAVLDGKNTFSQFTPKIGLTYDFKNNRGIYVNYSQGFVPPQVTELYRGNEVPTLKPVYYNNLELGGWVTFANEKAKLDVSVYKMDGFNEIISVLQDDGSTIRQNAGETTHQGVEYGLNFFPHPDLKFRLSGTNALHKFIDFNESGEDFSGNKMPQAPEWIANAQVTYTPRFFKGFRVSLEWQHIDEYFMDQRNTKTYRGHDILNVRVGYTRKSFEIWANLLNTTNELYSTVARATAWGQSYSLGRPRNINIGIAYKFQQK